MVTRLIKSTLARRLGWAALLVLLTALASHAQTPGVPVTATLVDGQGNIQKTGYLHWELWNCGNNVPQIVGNPYAIVAQQFDMRPNPTTGLIVGAVYGKDQILCGNVNSTQWLVTQFKASGQAAGNPQYYCLTSLRGGGLPFDPSTTQPCQITPPPPGYRLLFGNPIQNQTWTQPPGTEAFLVGTFDFSNATIIGFNGGGGGGGGFQFSVNLLASTKGNFSNTTPAPQNGYLPGIFQGPDVNGNVSVELPYGNTPNSFALGSAAVLKDNLGNATVPATLQANQIQTTGTGPWSVDGSYGALPPPIPTKDRLYFSNSCPGQAGGDISLYQAGSAVPTCYAHVDSGGNVIGGGYNVVESDAASAPSEKVLNLISGTNSTVNCADNPGQTRTDCTISSTGGGGGGGFTNPTNIAVPIVPLALPGAGTTSFGIGLDGNLEYAASGIAHYSDVPTKAVLGYTDDYIWSFPATSPTSLSAGVSATVTIPCPRGIDPVWLIINGDTLTGDYWIEITGTGTAETAFVTATTCTSTSNGASGTITFTPKNSHSAGYVVGTATQGAQEAINALSIIGYPNIHVQLPCTASGPNILWDAIVETHTNGLMIDGGGCARVTMTHAGPGLILGDHVAGANNVFINTVQGVRFIPGYGAAGTITSGASAPLINLINAVTISGYPGPPCTWLVTFKANHDLKVGDWIENGGFLQNNYMAGIEYQVATVPAANQITFQTISCPNPAGTTLYAGGWTTKEYLGIVDNLSNHGHLLNMSFGAGSGNYWNHLIAVISDESLDMIGTHDENSGGVLRAMTSEWHGSAIYLPGPSGYNHQNAAGILNMEGFTYYCVQSTCVDDMAGNDINFTDGVFEDWGLFGVRVSTRRGGGGATHATMKGVHMENGGHNDFGNMGVAGIVDTGLNTFDYAGNFNAGAWTGPGGTSFGTNGNNLVAWAYYIQAWNSSTDPMCTTQPNDARCTFSGGAGFGNGPLLPIGFCTADSGTGGTCTPVWPAVREATHYTLLRATEPVTGSLVVPIGTGTWLIQDNINPLTSCSGGSGQVGGEPACSVVDSVGLVPTNYSVTPYVQSSWCPYLDFWPGSLTLGCGGDFQASNGVYATAYNGPAQYGFVTTNTPGTNVINFTNQFTTPTPQTSGWWMGFPYVTQSTPPASVTQAGVAKWFPCKSAVIPNSGDGLVNLTGCINLEYGSPKAYPYDLITYEMDSANFNALLATGTMHGTNNATDSADSMDQAGGLARRCKVTCSFYIGTRADNSSWKMRLDSAGLHLTLPIFVDHLVITGTAPTCAFTSGGGTTPACTVTTGSANGAGTIIATTGTGSPGGTGTITLTFASAMGTHYGNCLYMASDNGAGTWAALPVMKDKTPSTTTDLFTWTNGTVPTTLTTSTAYQINYHCEAQ